MGVIIPRLEGGLGDQLFQIAGAMKLASGSGNNFILLDRMLNGAHRFLFPKTIISSGAFMIGKRCIRVEIDKGSSTAWRPYKECADFLSQYSKTKLCVYLHGSLQNHVFVPSKFNQLLSLPPVIGSQEASACFIHINKECTNEYYSRSIDFMRDKHGITKFIVFVDIHIRDTPNWLQGIDYQIMKYNEVDSLARMVQCKAGIASTATLSWWGAYLNPDRPICMPSNFPASDYNPRYFFPGVYVVPV